MDKIDNSQFNILIVDDISKNLQVLGSYLQGGNYEVEFAINGKSALEWIKKKCFDLILLDIMMPGMSGFEVCKEIRRDEKYNDIPVLFLTAKDDKESVAKGFQLGAQDYITKPFDKEELLARINTHLDLKYKKEVIKKTNIWLKKKVAERTGELKKANLKLEKAYAELMFLDDSKTEFLNIISHEIRTPLNGISGFLEVIKSSKNKDKLDLYLNALDLSVKRLERFSLTALKITHLKIKKKKINTVELNLKDLITASAEMLKEEIKNKSISLEIYDLEEIKIKGNPELLLDCISSIIENAVRFSEKKSKIRISSSIEKENIKISFIDEGKGFSAKALKNLFVPFSPGEIFIDSNKGLSLTMAKIIMDLHSGKILIKNNEKKGSIVTLVFKKR